MLRKLALLILALAVLGGLCFWLLTIPSRLGEAEVAALPAGDAAAGERIFNVGGCASCHAAPKSEGDKRFELPGGVELATPFGIFVTPNISQHREDGIGAWSLADFATAMLKGVSPDGRHYYPAFPYTSYARMDGKDIADLFAFLKTVPAIKGKAPGHQLGFPFNIRRGLGLWKLMNLSGEPVIALGDDASDEVRKGRYLVEGPGHCGECHSPRDFGGAIVKSKWLSGAVAAEGKGVVPNITAGEGGIGAWSAGDIAYYLETGFTPEFDSVGGAMSEVQRNMAELPAEDRAAIAAYLKAVPPLPNGYPAKR
ncbi:MAG: cytochrome c [Rhizobiaceae bacterium]